MRGTAKRLTVAEAREQLDSLAARARTGEVLGLTAGGEVVAELVPPSAGGRVGCMRGTIRIVGDDLAPATDEWLGCRRTG